jgi:hypothetical protein
MLGLMRLMRPMGLIIKCFAFFWRKHLLCGRADTWICPYFGGRLDGDNTIFGNSHRHFVPPRSLGKTCKEGDLSIPFSMD